MGIIFQKLKKDSEATPREPLLSLARPARLERAAYGFEVRRSIQLSYGRVGCGIVAWGGRIVKRAPGAEVIVAMTRRGRDRGPESP